MIRTTPRFKYPIGIQTFEKIIEGNYVYVDKTEYIYNLTHNSTYVFLSRPRRFGKSLLTSTFESYFEGRKDLFENLKLGQLEKEWVKYPVFRFDVSQAKKKDISQARMNLNEMVQRYERIYNTASESEDLTDRLKWLFEKVYEQTGQKVVVLIDEYDSPLLEVMHDDEKLREFRDLFRSFYSPIKSCDQYIRFAFITGRLYTLAVPNNEVRIGIYKNLVPYYVHSSTQQTNVFIAYFGVDMIDNKVEEALGLMRSFISEIPYEYMQQGEKSYHFIFFIISRLLCAYVQSDVHNSAGRTDMVLKTRTHIYVFEFKYDGKVENAMLQIEEKGYTIPYESDGREIVKIAVNFNSKLRTIDEWRIKY
ncbi:MAG: AAA family ATPase [Marinilabiliaceae bacterium]|nr:AAA family ATPase [Marinilabiliaceae bacterium]